MSRTRRSFLQMMGGGLALGLAGPLLPSLTPRARAADGVPCRFVFVVEGNCAEPVCFLSEAARAELDGLNGKPVDGQRWWYRDYQHGEAVTLGASGLASAKALDVLAGAGDEVSLESKAAVVFGLSNKVAGGGHYTSAGALACARSTPASPGGRTIDAFLAGLPQVRQSAPFDAVRLGVVPNKDSSRINYTTCAYDVGRPAPVIVHPTTAYGNLFSAVGTPDEVAAFERRGALLDFGLSSTAKRLACFRGDAAQRAKLEQYKSALEELIERQATLLAMKDTLEVLKPPGPAENALFEAADPLQRLEAQFQLATAALIAGLTNVVVIGVGAGGPFDLEYPSYNGVLDGRARHDLHHQSSGNQPLIDTIHSITRDQIGLTAALARALEAQPEAGGTMLDHTVIVYLGDNGEQHHSTGSEWPLLVIGGQGLGLKTDGRTVLYPGVESGSAGHRQLSSFFTTLAHAAGEPIERFGNEGTTLVAEGPLPELWS